MVSASLYSCHHFFFFGRSWNRHHHFSRRLVCQHQRWPRACDTQKERHVVLQHFCFCNGFNNRFFKHQHSFTWYSDIGGQFYFYHVFCLWKPRSIHRHGGIAHHDIKTSLRFNPFGNSYRKFIDIVRGSLVYGGSPCFLPPHPLPPRTAVTWRLH